jgi:uncharacterized protein (DUF302 family)
MEGSGVLVMEGQHGAAVGCGAYGAAGDRAVSSPGGVLCRSLKPLIGSRQRSEPPGAKLFLVVDHRGEAQRVGMVLRDTKLLVLGNPAGGTPAMVASPLAGLDLPLKVLVWMNDDGAVWMSYLDAGWLAARHGLATELAAPLSAVHHLVADHALAAELDGRASLGLEQLA